MVIMDNYYIRDRKPELWAKINTLHLSYLEMEESPQKLEHKNKLDDCIKKFLCVAPHNQKFCFKETAEVLHRSASRKKDFSGYRAALGWNAIGMYAGNLISQPWRQEYREIKTYSGFYKHQIEANLVGAEIMFEAMGYTHAGNGVLVLEGPVCPDTVKYVSQDSLVAYVECQILKEIWEQVSESYKISWLEVLEFREAHLCSPKKAIEALKYQIQQRQYQEQQRTYSQGNTDYVANNDRYSTHVHQYLISPTLPSNHSFPPLTTTHAHLPMPLPQAVISPPQYIYNNGYYPNNYHPSCGMLPAVCNNSNTNVYGHVMKQPYNGGYYCNGFVQQPCVIPVPTAQLIEIEPMSRPNYDLPDGINKIPAPEYNSDENYNKSSVEVKVGSPPKTYAKDDVTGTFESWDYVYRNLESQGYSKDLGERGDVLSTSRRESRQKEPELKVNDRPMKINEALEKLNFFDKTKKLDNNKEWRVSNEALSSSYDNLSTQELVKKVTANVKNNATSTAQRFDDSEAQTRQISKTLDIKKLKTNQNKIKPQEKSVKPAEVIKEKVHVNKENSEKWQCSVCTYLNDNSKTICEICSKSKKVLNQEMEIGGSECSQCTLVNPKSNKTCDACQATLQNSPTYI